MKHRGRSSAFLLDAAGHTLVEVAVAASLIVTVVVPLGGVAVYLLSVKQNEPYLVALTLAQRTMEETLYRRSYETQIATPGQGRWRVVKTMAQNGNQVTIVVRVFHKGRPQPLVELMTIRLLS